MNARELITDHLDLWTSAVTTKSTVGRGTSSGKRGKIELTGINKLRELILELAVRGKLVEQDPDDEPASVLLERIAEEKARLVKEGKIKKHKKLPEIGEEEKPFELPAGWQWARLSDVLRVINGRAYKKHEMLQEGTPLLRVGNLFTSNEWYYSDLQLEDDKYIDHGDLIYAWSASFGPFIWAGSRAIYHYHIWKLELFDHSSTNKLFLYNYLKAVTEEIKSSGSGIAMTHMTKAKMEELVVPLPPHEEQQRIVKKVDELTALCDRLEQQVGDQLEAHEVLVDTLLDALTRSADAAEVAENWARIAEHFDTLFTTEASIDKLKQTILQLAVMGRLVEQDPNDEPASALLAKIKDETKRLVSEGSIKKPKRLEAVGENVPYEIPASWQWEKLGSFTLIGTGATPSRDRSDYYSPPEHLWVTSGETSQAYIHDTKERVSSLAVKETNISIYPAGTLVVAMYGQGKTRGQISELKVAAGTNQACAAVQTIINDACHRKYIKLCFIKLYDEIREGAAGGAQPNLNTGKIANTLIPLPPLEEQHRIVEKVVELMALCDNLKARLSEAGETRTFLAEAVVEQAVN